jgi:hypothetical protein
MTFVAREIQTIIDEMVIDKEARTELVTLDNPSNAAIWLNLLSMFAAECFIVESEFEDLETDLNLRALEIPVGTLSWYAAETKFFQYGDSLVVIDGVPQYSVVDETKRIVEVSSATLQSGFVLIKAAKLDVDDIPEPLSSIEKTALEQYWIEKRFAGESITIISQEGDVLKIIATIEVDGLKIATTGESQTEPGVYPVEDAILNYLKNLNFNGRFYRAQLENAIQAVDGVSNIVINTLQAKVTGGVDYVNILTASGQSYLAVAGYLIEDPDNLLRDTLIYTL